MEHYVYVIESELDGTFYVGVSLDPIERLRKHNRPHRGYTSRKQPWKIVYTEVFSDRTEALKREKFIKSQKSREFILNLITASGRE